MTAGEQAWCVEQWALFDRTQISVGSDFGISVSVINIAVKDFCDAYSNADVSGERIYGEWRKLQALHALQTFKIGGGTVTPPQHVERERYDRDYVRARRTHAGLLRCEGLTFEQIGTRLGVSKDRARQLTMGFAHILRHAMKDTHFAWVKGEGK